MSDSFLYITVFILGAVVGSFLNVCIYRIPRGLSIILPSSRCPSCNSPIELWNNIPILSYFFLGGKCKYCKSRISIRYPLVESLNALIYVFVLWRLGYESSGSFIYIPVYFAFVSSLIVITFIDLEFQIIPNRITLPGIIVSLIFGSTVLPDPFSRSYLLKMTSGTGAFTSLTGIILGGGLFYLIALIGEVIFKKEAMGGGDIKMMAMIGGVLGWKGVILTTFLGSLIGSIVGISLIILKGKEWGSRIPFGPYLAVGALVNILSGQEIVRWYLHAG
jgi:leader peptidase (prepilin peptidase)/N-methyltransferase